MAIGCEPAVQKETEISGTVLEAARQEAGLTVEVLAERIGVTERYITGLRTTGKHRGMPSCAG